MKPLNYCFQTCKHFQNRLNRYREIATRTKQKNDHVYVICCQPEVAGDVISGENVKTVKRYAVLNFEAGSISSFWENQNQPFT